MSENSGNRQTIVDMVKAIQQQIADDNLTLKGYEVSGYELLYRQLAEVYRVGKVLLARENWTIRQNLLKDHGIKETERCNVWTPVVKLMYGRWKEATLFHWFDVDRSAEKYAFVFSYLDSHQVSVENTAEFIKNFKGKNRNGLTGIVEAQREACRPKVDQDKLETYRELGMDEDDTVTIDRPDFVESDKEYGKLWCKVVGNEVMIYGFESMDEESFERLCVKRGKALSK